MYLYNLYTSHEGDAYGFLSKHYIVVISLTVCTYHTESVTQGTDKESGDYVLANKRRVIQFVQEWHRIIAEAFWEDNTICAFVEVSPNYRILPHMPNKRIGPIFHGYRTNDQHKCHKKNVKLEKQITYLSSCRRCKPVLNSAISAVPSRSHCSYSPHKRNIDQLTISRAQL